MVSAFVLVDLFHNDMIKTVTFNFLESSGQIKASSHE